MSEMSEYLTVTSSFGIAAVSGRALALKWARHVDASGSFRAAVVVSSGALVDVFAGESVAFEAGAAGALVRAERVRADRVRRTFVRSGDALVLVWKMILESRHVRRLIRLGANRFFLSTRQGAHACFSADAFLADRFWRQKQI